MQGDGTTVPLQTVRMAWLFALVLGLAVAWLGARTFLSLRQGFADVL